MYKHVIFVILERSLYKFRHLFVIPRIFVPLFLNKMILQEKASKLEEENKFQGCPAVNESYTNNRALVTPSAGSSRRGHDRCCYCCCRRRSNVRVGYSAVTER